MSDWLTYKGNDGNWKKEFAPSQADNQYNEGNLITTLGEPVWSTSRSRLSPVTEKHHPCGVWNRQYIPNPLPLVINTVVSPALTYIAWTPNAGPTGVGRFIGTNVLGDQMWYSDDGGENWDTVDLSWVPGAPGGYAKGYTLRWNYDTSPQHFSIGYTTFPTGVTWSGGAISYDGINWTPGPYLDVSFRAFTDIIYSPFHDTYIGTTSTGGGNSRVYYSNDCLNWTYYQDIATFGFFKLATRRNVVVALANNYNYARISFDNLVTWFTPGIGESWYPWSVAAPIPYRDSVVLYDDNFWYADCVMTGYGYWIDFPDYRFIRMDYNPFTSFFASWHDQLVAPLDPFIFHRGDYSWVEPGGANITVTDVALGYDRALYAHVGKISIVTGLDAAGPYEGD